MDTSEITRSIINGTYSNDELNLIIEAVKFARGQNARKAARTLRPGQSVRFMGRAGLVVGTLESIKIKNATVVTGAGRYRVPLSMLEAA
jgi:hypothetical protein